MRIAKLMSTLLVLAMLSTVFLAMDLSAEAGEEDMRITSVPSRFSDDSVLSFAYADFAYGDNDYDVELSMTAGDTFSYTVTTNVTSTVAISGTASAWLSVSDHMISGSPSEAGTYYLTITATASTSGVSQTAVQTVMFTVFDRLMMRVSDIFSYTVITNISSTISISGTASSWLSVSDHTISGSPSAAGTYSLDVTATANTSGVSQSASQSITIQVCERVAVSTSTSSAALAVGSSSGTILKTFASGTDWTGPSGTTVSCNVGSSGLFIWDTSTSSLKLSRSVSASDVGTYTVTWTVSYNPSGYAEADVQTHVVTISIYSDLAITSDNLFNTFVGSGSHTITVTTNHDGSSGASITKTASIPSSLSSYVTFANGVVTYNFNGYTTSSNTSCDVVSFTVSASGSMGGVTFTSTSQTITIKVYPMLEFVDLPTVSENVTVVPTTDDNLDLVLTSDIAGAERIKVYWGDGTFTQIDPTGGSSIGYSVRHHYIEEGEYNITIIASNDIGDQRAYVLYDAYDEGFSAFDGNADSTGFFDGHGNLWPVTLIVAVLAFLAYAFAWKQEYVLLIGLGSVAISVVLYIMGASL